MFIIGISGCIGSGKSTVSALCSEAGLRVLDADQISHEVTKAGGAALPEIVRCFGEDILASNGALNRKRMAALVFHQPQDLDRLSAIIHRHVLAALSQGVEEARRQGLRAIVLDVPIPVKNGFLDLIDQLWVVDAEAEQRLARLTARGLSEEDAQRRMSIQMTAEEYRDLADVIIRNNSDRASLRQTVQNTLARELGNRGIPFKALT